MSNVPADSQGMSMGFWKRVGLALEAMSESDEERLEKRVRRVEAEVARLSELQKTAGNGSRDGDAQDLGRTSQAPAVGKSSPA